MSGTAVAKRRPFSPEFAGKVTVDRMSLLMSDELSFEEWINLLQQLGEVGDSIAWWVGDAIEQGTVQYGGKYDEAMRVTALDYQTLQNYARVCRAFAEISRRREILSFGHHEVVAGLPSEVADAWLQRAIDEKWSIRDLRDEVRASRGLPTDTTVTLERLTLTVPEERAERWKHAADEAGLSFQEWCAATLDEAAA